MTVNFCGITRASKFYTDNCLLYYKILLESVVQDINRLKEKNFKYCRIQNLVSSEIFTLDMKINLRKTFKPELKCRMNYSYHLPYIFNNIKDSNFEYVKNYLIKLSYFIQNQSLYNLIICTHLSGNEKNDVENWSRLFFIVAKETGLSLKNYLCFENCDKGANLESTYKISKYFNIPFVYDNLHDYLNSSRYFKFKDGLDYYLYSWKLNNHLPYIHYSSYVDNKGTHGNKIYSDLFDVLDILKYNCKELILVPELVHYEKAIVDFNTDIGKELNWLSNVRFNY